MLEVWEFAINLIGSCRKIDWTLTYSQNRLRKYEDIYKIIISFLPVFAFKLSGVNFHDNFSIIKLSQEKYDDNNNSHKSFS